MGAPCKHLVTQEYARHRSLSRDVKKVSGRSMLSWFGTKLMVMRRVKYRDIVDLRRHIDFRFSELRSLILMATQADIDAVTAGLQDLKDKLTADDSAIQQEIANLQSQNSNLDLSGLQSAVSDLSTAVDNTTALVPAPSTGTTGDTGSSDGGATTGTTNDGTTADLGTSAQ